MTATIDVAQLLRPRIVSSAGGRAAWGSLSLRQRRCGQSRLPWSGEVIAAGTVETIVHNDMTVQLVARGQHLLDVFPSIRSAAPVADLGGRPIQLIRLKGDRYRRVDSALARADIVFIVDAPWFGGPLVETRRGPFLMNRDGQLKAFELQNPRAGLPGLLNTVTPFARVPSTVVEDQAFVVAAPDCSAAFYGFR